MKLFVLLLITTALASPLELDKKLEYSYSTEGKSHFFKVCPDNTCQIFESPKSVMKSTLSDFVIIHNCFGWGYNWDQFKEYCEKNRAAADSLLNKAAPKKCSKKDMVEKAKCTLKEMASKHSILLRFERSDLGETCVTTYNLDDILEKRSKPKFPAKSSCK